MIHVRYGGGGVSQKVLFLLEGRIFCDRDPAKVTGEKKTSKVTRPEFSKNLPEEPGRDKPRGGKLKTVSLERERLEIL